MSCCALALKIPGLTHRTLSIWYLKLLRVSSGPTLEILITRLGRARRAMRVSRASQVPRRHWLFSVAEVEKLIDAGPLNISHELTVIRARGLLRNAYPFVKGYCGC